ncbi:VolA/Pla-1 family phospholipase [Gayadomonas joobiniege]|uniref:VolA/Pla-1 family phospholipase n=1 Tax=Gayadomonas joobiniege TaxID=1234606 RepID=UPI000ACCD90A|nr:VolA/Pla-1 family phospholipase [Gayadomonas joobiniege]
MVKKYSGILAIAGLTLLAACDSETLSDAQQDSTPLIPATRVAFDPTNSVVALPNNLLFSGTQDGTLNIPVADSEDFSDPAVALSALDGWSGQQAFVIDFDVPDDVAGIDASSLQAAGSVRLFAVKMGSRDSSDECFGVDIAHVCKIEHELQMGSQNDYILYPSANDQLLIAPVKPLNPGSSYLVQLTAAIEDREGRAVKSSSSYQLVQQDITKAPLASDEQLSLQALVNASEDAIQAFGYDSENTIYSASFTVQSQPSLVRLKQLMAQSAAQQPGLTEPVYSGVNVKTALNPALASCPELLQKVATNTASASELGFVGFCNTELYHSTINLPYYSGIASETDPTAATGDNAWWRARCDSGALLQGYLAAGGTLPETAQSENDGFCLNFGLRDLGLDSERHITAYNPLPQVRGVQNLEVQVTVPNPQMIALMEPGNTVQMPENGWPVVILAHGIASKKEDMLALTAALSRAGFATVAMNLPLHGERGFDIDDDGQPDVVTDQADASAYMNLANLQATRDNLRQSVADFLQLRLALATQDFTFNGHQIDGQSVSFVGHSLGGIVGSVVTAIANTGNNAQLDNLFKLNSAVLANTSGGIAGILLESNAFGPFIKGNIVLAAIEGFTDYLTNKQQNIVTLYNDQTAYQNARADYIREQQLDNEVQQRLTLAERYFFAAISAGKNPAAMSAADHQGVFAQFATELTVAQQIHLEGLLAEFVFAAQTVIDAGDPNLYASWLTASQTPVLLTEIWGDGTSATWDQVIPPLVNSAELAGTERFARLLGAEHMVASGAADTNVLVRFNAGAHGSLLSPETSQAVTVTMQNLVAHWLKSNGESVLITDTSVTTGGGD